MYGAGLAVGAALAGQLIAGGGVRASLFAALVATAAATLVVGAGARHLHTDPAPS